jgi:protease-4
MQTSVRLLLWISILGAVLFTATLLAVFFVTRHLDSERSEARALVLHLHGEIADGPGQGAFVLDPRDLPPLLTEYADVIRTAAVDPDIDTLVLRLDPVDIGWAGVQELSNALLTFRETGKTCVSSAEVLTNREYVLAASCGPIYLSPAGLTLVNGLSVTQNYFAGSLELLGVRPNFEHVGRYKSAVEVYERAGPSDEAREAMDALIDDFFGQYVELIAQGREMDTERVLALVNDPPLTPVEAMERGLVDALLPREEVLDQFAGDEPTPFMPYLRKVRSDSKRKPYIAIVHAEGTIVSGKSGTEFTGGRYVGDEDLIRDLESARENQDVVAVVLRVNSPGGSGLASDNIWNAVQKLREEKPVVVSMGELAASGGYYIAMGADAIIAEPGTITGSIGVFGGKMNVSGLLDKLGVTMHKTSRGDHASLLSLTEDFSEGGRERFRSFLLGFYDLFLARVAEGRRLSVGEVDLVAQGRVWSGARAMDRGLVDALGGLPTAIEKARELAEVQKPTGTLRLPVPRTLIDEILEDLQPGRQESALSLSLPLLRIPGVNAAFSHLLRLARVLDGTGVAALSPVEYEVF